MYSWSIKESGRWGIVYSHDVDGQLLVLLDFSEGGGELQCAI